MKGEQPPDPETILQRLREAFPSWAFVHDPRTGGWTALRGDKRTGVTIQRQDPLALRLAVEESVAGR
jgi:hypothetical protein